jgi:hypothetical protein
MATRPATVTYAPGGLRELVQVTWSGLATGDDGEAVSLPGFADRSVQVEGTFGGSSTAIQGSNDGTNFRPLNDTTSTVLAFTAAAIEQVLEVTKLIRPIVTGGAGSGIAVTLIARR